MRNEKLEKQNKEFMERLYGNTGNVFMDTLTEIYNEDIDDLIEQAVLSLIEISGRDASDYKVLKERLEKSIKISQLKVEAEETPIDFTKLIDDNKKKTGAPKVKKVKVEEIKKAIKKVKVEENIPFADAVVENAIQEEFKPEEEFMPQDIPVGSTIKVDTEGQISVKQPEAPVDIPGIPSPPPAVNQANMPPIPDLIPAPPKTEVEQLKTPPPVQSSVGEKVGIDPLGDNFEEQMTEMLSDKSEESNETPVSGDVVADDVIKKDDKGKITHLGKYKLTAQEGTLLQLGAITEMEIIRGRKAQEENLEER